MQRVRTTITALRAVAQLAEKDNRARILVLCEDDRATEHHAREFFAEYEGQFDNVEMLGHTGRGPAYVKFGSLTTDPKTWAGAQWTMVMLLASHKTLTLLEAIDNARLGLRLGSEPTMYVASTDS